MEYQVNFGCWGKIFAVPNAVVDHFIRLASETQLKVLLYLLRNPEQTSKTETIAEFFRITEEQAEDAVQFWVQANILQLPGNSAEIPLMSGMDFMQSPAITACTPAAPPKTPALPSPKPEIQRSSKELKLDPSEIAAELEKSQALKDLFTCAESACGKLLNHMEQRSLIWIHSYLGIPNEVILLLMEYCISIGKNSIAYLEAIAIHWYEQDITTMEEAEAEIQHMTESHTFTSEIRRMFQMNRKPTKNQQNFIDIWQNAGYSMQLIEVAYELTIEQIEKLNFKYINRILENWASQGITTVEQVERLRTANAKPTGTNKKRDTSISAKELEDLDEYLTTVNRFRKE